jgi:hypothetical protein
MDILFKGPGCTGCPCYASVKFMMGMSTDAALGLAACNLNGHAGERLIASEELIPRNCPFFGARGVSVEPIK